MMCEKCWADAFTLSYGRGGTDQSAEYERLIKERALCTPQEQAGQWWDEELQQDSRWPVPAKRKPKRKAKR